MSEIAQIKSQLSEVISPLSGYERLSLEEILVALCRAGNPRCSKMKSHGWMASCEMHVSAAGTTFEVRSEFTHKTPNRCGTRVCAAGGGHPFSVEIAPSIK